MDEQQIDLKSVLKSIGENELSTKIGSDDHKEYTCHSSLLKGLKIRLSGNERKKLDRYKEMAKCVEMKLENDRCERRKNLKEQICKVDQRMKENHSKQTGVNVVRDVKPNGKDVLPYVYTFDIRENSKKPATPEHFLFSGKSGCVDISGGLKKYMDSLQTLQNRQGELDLWYENMQKQLEIEKLKLTEKYEELRLNNIREQQSVIDSSQDFLRSVSNNNSPCLLDGNLKQSMMNSFERKLKNAVSDTSMCADNSPRIIQSSTLPTLSKKMLSPDKKSLEYGTPCGSPTKNEFKKILVEDIDVDEAEEEKPSNTDTDPPVNNEDPVFEDEVIEQSANDEVVTQNGEDVSDKTQEKEQVNNNLGVPVDTNEDTSEVLLKSVQVDQQINNEEKDKIVQIESNKTNEDNHMLTKSLIHDDLKTVVTVPPRRSSTDNMIDSLDINRSSVDIEGLMKHSLERMEIRRKSRAAKIFTNLFPEDVSVDDEVISLSSHINSRTNSQKTVDLNGDKCQNVNSSLKSTKSPRQQIDKKDNEIANEDLSSICSQELIRNSISITNTICDTSTPERFQENIGVGLLLEISAVKLTEEEVGSPNFHPHKRLSSNNNRKVSEKLLAVVKGFLTRKLLKTIKIQEIIDTIKATDEFLNDIEKENIASQKLADRQLRVRLYDELRTKKGKLHDIFFNMEPKDQMKMLAVSRKQVEEKNRKKQELAKSARSNHTLSRQTTYNLSSNMSGHNLSRQTTYTISPAMSGHSLSTATQKSIKRRQTVASEKMAATKCVPEKKIVKNVDKMESVGANIHVCISGALKPIQSCTSPKMAVDRNKAKSPMRTNSVQNRYPKKSSASKKLDMNAAVESTHSIKSKSTNTKLLR